MIDLYENDRNRLSSSQVKRAEHTLAKYQKKFEEILPQLYLDFIELNRDFMHSKGYPQNQQRPVFQALEKCFL